MERKYYFRGSDNNLIDGIKSIILGGSDNTGMAQVIYYSIR